MKDKRLIITFALLAVLSSPALAAGADLKSDLNQLISNWILPIFSALCLMGAATGLAKNWDYITDRNSDQKKQGWMNVAYIVGYVAIIAAVLSLIPITLAAISLSI